MADPLQGPKDVFPSYVTVPVCFAFNEHGFRFQRELKQSDSEEAQMLRDLDISDIIEIEFWESRDDLNPLFITYQSSFFQATLAVYETAGITGKVSAVS